MPRFVALLRGVNVGRAKRVPMGELRELLESSGYTDVKTLLNSGNVVFNSTGRSEAAHAKRIHASILETIGVDTAVIVKSAQECAAAAAENKLASIAKDPSRLLVAFTADAKSLQELAALAPLTKPPERFHLGQHAAYLLCAKGILESRAGEALLGKLGRAATSRNWATFLKIRALLDEGTS